MEKGTILNKQNYVVTVKKLKRYVNRVPIKYILLFLQDVTN